MLNTFYHFVTVSPLRADQGYPGLISRATDRAAGMWADWGKAAPGTWKVGTLTFHRSPSTSRRIDPA